MPSTVLMILLAMASIRPDETIRNYGMGEDLWHVVELDGAAIDGKATMQFTGRYKIAGQAPCNSYQTSMEVPYPWFAVGPIGATKRACPYLAEETAFFAALRSATSAQVIDGLLVLSDDNTPLILFKPAD